MTESVMVDRRFHPDEPERPSADQLNSLGRIAGELLHDLNGIVAIIAANVQMARSEARSGHSPEPVLARLEHDVDHLGAMVRDVFDELRGRITSADNVFDPAAVARETIERWAPRNPGVEVELHAEVGPNVRIQGRSSWYSRALGNLLCNAMRYARSTVRITVEPSAATGWPGVLVAMEDDGNNLPAEVEERLFQPFTRGDAEGTGLGLSMVAYATNQLRGSVRFVRATRLGGARFEIWLPTLAFAPAPAPVSPPPSAAAAPRPLLRRAVCLIEDDPSVRRVFSRFLEREGAIVSAPSPLAATDPAALAGLILAAEPRVVLIDQHLGPDLRGDAVAEAVRAVVPSLPILLLSGAPEPNEHFPTVSKAEPWETILQAILDTLP